MTWDPTPVGKAQFTPPWDHTSDRKGGGNSGGHAEWVREVRERPADKPFFFWFASHDAHRAWDGDREWDAAKYGPMHRPEEVIVPPFLVDDPATRGDLASYYNEITRFDYFIGEVVKELTAQNALDDTLIFVLADNGRPFPRAKTRVHDSGMKTGLIAHWPAGISQSGRTCDSLVSTIDLAPTCLEAAGVKVPESVQGVSMLPLLKDPKAVTRRVAFSEHNWHDYEAYGRSVRADGFLYISNRRPNLPWQGPADSVSSTSHHSLQGARDAGKLTPAQADVFLAPRPVEELYKSADDPDQLNNLASDSHYSAEKKRLSALLAKWQEETADSVPATLSPDGFDRETGKKLKDKTFGTTPGEDRDAASVNRPGPR
jgi:arylsulfatase A-like enzyme